MQVHPIVWSPSLFVTCFSLFFTLMCLAAPTKAQVQFSGVREMFHGIYGNTWRMYNISDPSALSSPLASYTASAVTRTYVLICRWSFDLSGRSFGVGRGLSRRCQFHIISH